MRLGYAQLDKFLNRNILILYSDGEIAPVFRPGIEKEQI